MNTSASGTSSVKRMARVTAVNAALKNQTIPLLVADPRRKSNTRRNLPAEAGSHTLHGRVASAFRRKV